MRRQDLLDATELDTRLIMRVLKNTERVLNNDNVMRLQQIEKEKGGSLTIQDIHDQVAGVYPKVMRDGDLDAGAWSCGMVVGLHCRAASNGRPIRGPFSGLPLAEGALPRTIADAPYKQLSAIAD